MNDDKVRELIELLLERTREGNVKWVKTDEEENYQVDLNGVLLSLNRQLASDAQAFNYYIVLKDSDGKRITSIMIFHYQPIWSEANQLFYEAEEKAMDVDGVLASLIEYLKSSHYKVY
jgi:hypothetical protein